ncbi:hypothetical protein AADZ90_021200 [Aestuariibius sp. 2305UL40-4]|uniref:hypothetical protein n=1 Tax=Aestuariibius violaceus TaxID=3234132 RepID=UPI00345E2379
MEFIWTLVVCAGLTREGGCAAVEISAMPSLDYCMMVAQSTQLPRSGDMAGYATCELRRASDEIVHPRDWRIIQNEEMKL